MLVLLLVKLHGWGNMAELVAIFSLRVENSQSAGPLAGPSQEAAPVSSPHAERTLVLGGGSLPKRNQILPV